MIHKHVQMFKVMIFQEKLKKLNFEYYLSLLQQNE